ncbi:MAG: methionyl-tRNA formyltransferase [Candidatus Omnitrophica bacterium]|nr:methionyl-tRNA formyltransferase [Candidatus Omnitrophota bacterium]
MDIVFFGSSRFAVEPLNKLLSSENKIVCVVTQPDQKQGRGLKLSFTPIKEMAIKNNLNFYQPQDLASSKTIDFLKKLSADLFVVVAYGKILPQKLLDVPKIFAINLHASLLPKYRGAAPINWAIIKGEKETGISIIKMNQYMDAGEIILQKKIPIDNTDTNITLSQKLSHLGSEMLLEAIDLIANNKYNLVPQDEAVVSFAPLLKKEDGLIDWKKPARDIYNLIRGCLVWPGAFTHYKNKILKIWEAVVNHQMVSEAEPGTIINLSKEGILVKTGQQNLLIIKLQLESGKAMSAYDFLQGHKLNIGDKFI